MSKESIPALKRKIERLEALNLALKEDRDRAIDAAYLWLDQKVIAETRIKQAMKLLNGEDV